MPYCPYCGVNVDNETTVCPLCTTDIPIGGEPPLLHDDYPRKNHKLHYKRRTLTGRERRSLLWFFSILCSVPIAVVLGIDLRGDWAVSWSIYPVVGIGGAMIGIVFALFIRRPWLLLLLFGTLTVGLCIAYTALTDSMHIFLTWEIPIIIIAGALVTGVGFYTRHTKRKGFNIVAMIMWAIAIFALSLDIIIGLNLEDAKILYNGSIIVVGALGPAGALMMYVHHNISKRISFRRFFNV